ncbi:uncharacterized protein A1O9_05668 [Exophiala aquamarina CBS 119918]|uniref:Uncharacterized protein n=1 Tax=Exophiala aquamarina CBS 119918 TaxID=1182545 RepID=A0A072PEP2_9EURO|nr:uncharacterized protein A1O9_05668 [Exophiala aquamarina CBS 119918]KEF57748.1 hypothetical protein A1O9_05668 [Exophiala aquamarina CBS 119918]
MLVRAIPKLLLLLCPLLFVVWLLSSHKSAQKLENNQFGRMWKKKAFAEHGDHEPLSADSKDSRHLPIPPGPTPDVDDDGKPIVYQSVYNEISSLSSVNGQFIPIHFGGVEAYNPTIIPHPIKYDQWIIIAHPGASLKEGDGPLKELTCNAGFVNSALSCAEVPLPVPLTIHEPHCTGALAYLNFEPGPRDARVVHGPDAPYILYGAHSEYTCLGVWIQDLRLLLEDYAVESTISHRFTEPKELQRPPPLGELEKNYFVFWDLEHNLYVHHSLSPRRVFAAVDSNGHVGQNLAPQAAESDDACLARYMPVIGSKYEAIRQATNSLSVTMCKRTDPTCKPGPENTFIMHIFHFKSFYEWHGVYEPYVVLFQQQAPFAVHGIAKKPFWVKGRQMLTEATMAVQWEGRQLPAGHSEMFYITSMSWKTHGQKYHGYMDDELFVTFGIEDSKPGVIDVLASDLLRDMAYCRAVPKFTASGE